MVKSKYEDIPGLNRLRMRLGFTIKEMCETFDLSYSNIYIGVYSTKNYEYRRISPEKAMEIVRKAGDSVIEILSDDYSHIVKWPDWSNFDISDDVKVSYETMRLERRYMEDPCRIAERSESASVLMEVIEELPFRDRLVVLMRNGIGECSRKYTLKEIGRILDLTRERVRQIESQALEKVKRELEKRGCAGV